MPQALLGPSNRKARWKTQQPASEVLIAIPDAASQRNLFAIEIPKLGSIIASGNWTARETLAVMFWPYLVPYSVTVDSAAAPDASLRFLFYGGIVVLPVITVYTIGVYWVFRGKVGKA